MIPLKNFDDKRFLQLIEEARGLIHRYSDEWTDENYHDPGITFLEMLTWLTEMQRFYLSRISDVSMNQLVELMGYHPQLSSPAKGIVQFTCHNETVFLPSYSQVKASDQIFETDDYIDIVDANIRHIINYSQEEFDEQTQCNQQTGMSYHPFGGRIETGNYWILMLDKPLQADKVVQIYLNVYDGYAISLDENCRRKHGISFELLNGLSVGSESLSLERDDTKGFMQSGIVRFLSPRIHEKQKIGGLEGYPLIFKVTEDYDLLPPQINEVLLNVSYCLNKNHEVQKVDLASGENYLQFELAFTGKRLLQKKTENGWIDVNPEAYSVAVNTREVLVSIPDKGQYQMIFWRDTYGENTVIGSSSGFPGEGIRFSSRNTITQEFALQCGALGDDQEYWTNYRFTDSFLRWGNDEKVFSVDHDKEMILFGNHEHGFLPEEGSNNVRIVTLQNSSFERGNIKAGQIQNLQRDKLNSLLEVNNPYDFSDGRSEETKEQTLQQVIKHFEHKRSLVTADDYRKALRKYPDARILYVNAYMDENVDNRIKVMIVPYTGERFPKVSEKFVDAVMAYIDQFRLITSSVEFVYPAYIEATVYVELSLDQPRLFSAEKAHQVLYDRFNPIKGTDVTLEYEPGSIPLKSDLIESLLKLNGVGGIKRLDISIAGGNMPKHGVIYCNQIHLNYE